MLGKDGIQINIGHCCRRLLVQYFVSSWTLNATMILWVNSTAARGKRESNDVTVEINTNQMSDHQFQLDSCHFIAEIKEGVASVLLMHMTCCCLSLCTCHLLLENQLAWGRLISQKCVLSRLWTKVS